MTAAKAHHRAARTLMLQHLDSHPARTVHDDLDPLEAGIVGDTAHAEGGDSYHLGADKIRARAGRNRYSVDESARDQRGLDEYASAVDYGYFRVTTGRGTFDLYDYNTWLIALCRAGDPDTADLREVIYSPDGRTVRRWDALGVRTTGDASHLTHTHHSEFRNATGVRMVRLATRWLQHIALIPEEDDVDAKDIEEAAYRGALRALQSGTGRDAVGQAVMGYSPGRRPDGTNPPSIPNPYAPPYKPGDPRTFGPGVGTWNLGSSLNHLQNRAAMEALEVPPTAAATAQAVIDAFRTNSPEQTATVLRAALGDQAAAVGRLLAQ